MEHTLSTDIRIALRSAGWFVSPGAYVLVDGQFGSTGKGLLAGLLAEYGAGRLTHVTTNAGPNSGHTAYYQAQDGEPEKIMTQQIPIASVFLEKIGAPVCTILNGGAIIDPDILSDEVSKYGMTDAATQTRLLIHPTAAIIIDEDRQADRAIVGKVAGTGKGIGPAIARKTMRLGGPDAVETYRPMLPGEPRFNEMSWDRMWDWRYDVVFVETAQGYSLGLNSARFYPHVTSRECTVMQAIADARIPVDMVRETVVCLRTYPIRVGNSPEGGYSGDCYPDQRELTWEEIGVEPEITTVTKRVRRVFSWSRIQFQECMAANRPSTLFLNFANYMKPPELRGLIETMMEDYRAVIGHDPDLVLLGFGPNTGDIITLDTWFEQTGRHYAATKVG